MKYLLILTLCLSGCALNQYKARYSQGTITGYEETKMADGTYSLRYVSGPNSVQQDTYNMFLRRASELTIANGSKYFKVKDGKFAQNQEQRLTMTVTLPEYSGIISFTNELSKDSISATDSLKDLAKK